MKKYRVACCIIFSLICSCQAYQSISVQYSRLQIQPTKKGADTIAGMLKQYRILLSDSLQKSIAFSNHPWFNKAPDYALANLLADGIWNTVCKQDSSVAGVLMPATILQGYWPRGNITLLQLYQLLPENKIWGTVTIQGTEFLSLLMKLMEQGRWTVSKNIQIIKQNNQELTVTLSGKPLQKDTTYNIVMVYRDAYSCGKEWDLPIDFLWGKGELRRMLLDYCISFSRKGMPLPLLQEKRIYAGDD